MPFKKCPSWGCSNDILIQDEMCYICCLEQQGKLIKINAREQNLFATLKQIIEQFNGYIGCDKSYTESSLATNMRHCLDFSHYEYDQESFWDDYPILFQMFPEEFHFWITLKENFLKTLKRVSGGKIESLKQKLAIEKDRSLILERKANELKKRFKVSSFRTPDGKLLDKTIMLEQRLETEEDYSSNLEIKLKELKEEIKVHMDAMKTMDNWYLQRNRELIKENQQKDRKIKELEKQLENLKLEFKSEISSIQKLNNWQNIHSNFTEKLINQWQSLGFTCQQTQDWINIHSLNDQIQAIQEPEFYAWLRDIKNLTVEQVLNDNSIDFNTLKLEFQQSQLQTFQVQQDSSPIIYNKHKQ